MKDRPCVGVVIVNVNGWRDTVRCIESLRRSRYSDWAAVVVDNGSVDESVKEISERCPEVHVVSLRENRGFASGCNEGIRLFLQRQAEFVLLLNNDAVVGESCLKALVDTAHSDNRVGIVSGKIYFDNGSGEGNRLWYAGGRLKLWSARCVTRGYRQLDEGLYDATEQVTFVSGCCMLLRSDVLRDIGAFDDRYFLSYEDADLCWRAQRSGWKLLYAPAALIWHKEAATLGSLTAPRYVYFQWRSRLAFARKNCRPYQAPLVVAHIGLSTAKALLTFSLRRQWPACRSVVKAVRDFVFRHDGDLVAGSFDGPTLAGAKEKRR